MIIRVFFFLFRRWKCRWFSKGKCCRYDMVGLLAWRNWRMANAVLTWKKGKAERKHVTNSSCPVFLFSILTVDCLVVVVVAIVMWFCPTFMMLGIVIGRSWMRIWSCSLRLRVKVRGHSARISHAVYQSLLGFDSDQREYWFNDLGRVWSLARTR